MLSALFYLNLLLDLFLSQAEQNFFDVGESGYLENPTSDLLPLFMGSAANGSTLACEGACSLVKGCTDDFDVSATSWSSVAASREVS